MTHKHTFKKSFNSAQSFIFVESYHTQNMKTDEQMKPIQNYHDSIFCWQNRNIGSQLDTKLWKKTRKSKLRNWDTMQVTDNRSSITWVSSVMPSPTAPKSLTSNVHEFTCVREDMKRKKKKKKRRRFISLPIPFSNENLLHCTVCAGT